MKVHSKPVALFVCPECGHTATMYEDGAPASETTEAQPSSYIVAVCPHSGHTNSATGLL